MSTSLRIDRVTRSSRRASIDGTEAHSIEMHIALDHLSHCGPGSAVPGSAVPGGASFPGRLGRGSDVRLGAAGTVPSSMNVELTGSRFLRESDALFEETGIRPQGFGERAMSGPGLVLRPGRRRSPTLGTDDKVGARMANAASAAEPGAGLCRGRRDGHSGRCDMTHGREK